MTPMWRRWVSASFSCFLFLMGGKELSGEVLIYCDGAPSQWSPVGFFKPSQVQEDFTRCDCDCLHTGIQVHVYLASANGDPLL